jgi:hypothetical protein
MGLTARSHQTPIDRDRVSVFATAFGDQMIDRMIASFDIQKFVGVDDQNPICAADKFHSVCPRIGCTLWVHPRAGRVVKVFDDAHLIEPVQQQVRSVRAIIGKDAELIDPDGFMIGQPF